MSKKYTLIGFVTGALLGAVGGYFLGTEYLGLESHYATNIPMKIGGVLGSLILGLIGGEIDKSLEGKL